MLVVPRDSLSQRSENCCCSGDGWTTQKNSMHAACCPTGAGMDEAEAFLPGLTIASAIRPAGYYEIGR
eukprot:6467902-Amphidinium_carterae.1